MVVIPDILSKNASLKEKSKLANMKGIEPNIAIDNQAKATYGTITNTASLTSLDQTEENAGNNTDTADVTPVGIDLQVLKTVNNANPEEGATVTYTVTVENLSGH